MSKCSNLRLSSVGFPSIPVFKPELWTAETTMTALLVIQIMPVKYSIVKDQTLVPFYNFTDAENRLSVSGRTTFGFEGFKTGGPG
jgi:hypothetical protein